MYFCAGLCSLGVFRAHFQVAAVVGLRETWYFGLSYDDGTGMQAWLSMEKKVPSSFV